MIEREEIVQFILDHIREHHYAPTQQEIATAFEVAIPTIQYHLAKLADAGLISWESGKARTLCVVRKAQVAR